MMYSSTVYCMMRSNYNLPVWGYNLCLIISVTKRSTYSSNHNTLTMEWFKHFNRQLGIALVSVLYHRKATLSMGTEKVGAQEEGYII